MFKLAESEHVCVCVCFFFLEPVNRATAAREFRVFHAALHSLNSAYRDSVSRKKNTHRGAARGDTHL